MCKSIAEGGQRCFSHTNKEYQKALETENRQGKELRISVLELQNVRNSIERLDIGYEMGYLNDEDYNTHLDTFVAQRKALEETVKTKETAYLASQEETKKALVEVQTTKTGLANLKNEIYAETDALKKQKKIFAYNYANRLRNLRQQAFERSLVRAEKAKQYEEQAKIKRAAAQELPEYDADTARIKHRALVEAELLEAKAYLERQNGGEKFPALFDKQGNVFPAKIITTNIKGNQRRAWAILSDPKNPSSKPKGFLTIPQSNNEEYRKEFYAKKGFTVGQVWADARADIVKGQNGMEKVSINRADGGYSPYAKVILTNQYEAKQ
ncbi:MAG: hypothetical protein H9W81_17395 [Enterococcus sp.]|nr:hypothetical protein [Enterococcus sp.]